ncbi:MAG: ribosome-associated translation inhibitor RaiA [Candidatus Vogelbacteria bacterium]|nr:ribosome-associated translation inhibitor RaiA [Candidatus Vogelbacteria bacterium]
MKINFQATNLELNNEWRNYIINKLAVIEKLLDRRETGDEGLAEVELGRVNQHHKHGNVFRAEINLHWSGHRFRSESEAGDLYTAIDEVKDELLREIKTWRKKQGKMLRRGARALKNFLRGVYNYKWPKR